MTVEKCYEAMNGDYKDALGRLVTEERIKKFLLKLLNDPSYSELCAAMEKKKLEDAFRAAHTLKGVCSNLSVSALACSASNLTEALRGREAYGDDLDELLKQVKQDYSLTISAIRML